LKDQIAGAQIDTITRAMALGAPATITYAGAVDFLTKKQKEANDAQKAYETGVSAITEAGENWRKTLDTIDGSIVEADQELHRRRRLAEGSRGGVRSDGGRSAPSRRRARPTSSR
jgi:hypothetical protein